MRSPQSRLQLVYIYIVGYPLFDVFYWMLSHGLCRSDGVLLLVYLCLVSPWVIHFHHYHSPVIETITMSLLNLPNQLLLIPSIVRELEINAFSRTNHLFHAILNPYLYERSAECSASALEWVARRGLLSTACRAFDAEHRSASSQLIVSDQTSLLVETAYGGFTEVSTLILDHIAPKDVGYALSITWGVSRSTHCTLPPGTATQRLRVSLSKGVSIWIPTSQTAMAGHRFWWPVLDMLPPLKLSSCTQKLTRTNQMAAVHLYPQLYKEQYMHCSSTASPWSACWPKGWIWTDSST